jgi:hypothetical protein
MTSWTDDIGGGYHDRWDGIIDNPCPECRAPAGEKCFNALSKKPKHMPCWKRTKVTA